MFQYDNTLVRSQGIEEKKNQSQLQNVKGSVERLLTQKVLDFLDKV